MPVIHAQNTCLQFGETITVKKKKLRRKWKWERKLEAMCKLALGSCGSYTSHNGIGKKYE